MADTILAITARRQPDIEDNFDSALSTVLSNTIIGFSASVVDSVRSRGTEYRIAIGYADSGEAIAQPYQLKVFDGKTVDAMVESANAFIAANPAYWFGPIQLALADGSRRTDPVLGLLIYNTDADDGAANWGLGGGSGGGVLAGDVTGPFSSTTVVNIQSTPVNGSPTAGGSTLKYDAVAGLLKWVVTPVYSSLANAAADQANQIIGGDIIISGSPGGVDDGVYRVNAKTGSPADYTLISSGTTSAADVNIVDSGGFYSGTDVEAALEEVGLSTLGGMGFSGLTAGTTTIATAAVATYRRVIWDVFVEDGAGNVESFTVDAQHDDTDPQHTVYGMGPQGTVPVTPDVIINAGNLELQLIITGGATWNGHYTARYTFV